MRPLVVSRVRTGSPLSPSALAPLPLADPDPAVLRRPNRERKALFSELPIKNAAACKAVAAAARRA